MAKQNIKERDSKSRRRLQQLLKMNGAMEAARLAEELGISAMAVRQHLYALQEEGLITHELEARPKGRPAKLWKLTAEADSIFPDAHAELTVGLLQAMQGVFGDDGMDRLLEARRDQQAAHYRNCLAGAADLPAQLEALKQTRSSEGYMADWEEAPEGGYLFIENHCPICAAARHCQGLCALELDVFRTVLGEETQVERIDHIIQGARRCAYRITSRTG